MIAQSKVIALVSASLFLGTSATMASLAIGHENGRAGLASAAALDVCPPGACSIVVKTSAGGPPSLVRSVDEPASSQPISRSATQVLIADARPRS